MNKSLSLRIFVFTSNEEIDVLRAWSVNREMPSRRIVCFLETRSINLAEHLRYVKLKKEEADLLRQQRLLEQLRKKEAKW